MRCQSIDVHSQYRPASKSAYRVGELLQLSMSQSTASRRGPTGVKELGAEFGEDTMSDCRVARPPTIDREHQQDDV